MESLFPTVTGFLAGHTYTAYAFVFLLALSESIPVIGAFVPGSALILGIATLVPQGAVALWPLLISALLGAIVGDGLSYGLGHRYHREILGRWPLNRHPDLLARSEAFVQRHGGKSVFLARFTPGVRAFVPLMVGILRMPERRFYAANLLSALAWAPSHVLPGILVGSLLGIAGGVATGRLAVLIAVGGVALYASARLVRYALRQGAPLVAAGQEWLWAWADAGDGAVRRWVRPLLDPSRHEGRTIALLAAIILGSAWTFLGILEDVVSGDPLVRIDIAIYRIFQSLRTPWGDAAMIAITELGDTAVALSVTVVVFLWFAWRRAWRTAAYWAGVVGVASAINLVIKAALHRARPGALFYPGWSEFSFPSGHSTVNAVLYGWLAFLISRQVRPALRVPVSLGAAMLVILIAVSRVYLGAHWFSDVAGGLVFATAWGGLLAVVYLQHRAGQENPRGLLIVACSALVLTGGFHVYRHHAADVERYAIRHDAPAMAAAAWWKGEWQRLPAQRIDLEGETEEPFTIQWAGSLDGMTKALSRKGWRKPESWTLPSALGWLAANPEPARLPVLPYFERGRAPSLTLIRPKKDAAGADSRLVLRLWEADFTLENGRSSPMWIGSVVEERLRHPFSLFTLPVTQPDVNAPREDLAVTFGDGRIVNRRDREIASQWDGNVLLAREFRH